MCHNIIFYSKSTNIVDFDKINDSATCKKTTHENERGAGRKHNKTETHPQRCEGGERVALRGVGARRLRVWGDAALVCRGGAHALSWGEKKI